MELHAWSHTHGATPRGTRATGATPRTPGQIPRVRNAGVCCAARSRLWVLCGETGERPQALHRATSWRVLNPGEAYPDVAVPEAVGWKNGEGNSVGARWQPLPDTGTQNAVSCAGAGRAAMAATAQLTASAQA